MQVVDIDRVMIVASDAEEATDRFSSLLDLSFGSLLDIEIETSGGTQRVDVSHAYPGLEIVAPGDANNAIEQYLDEHGPGLFALVLRVRDAEVALAELSETGIEPVADDETENGRELHYHPKDFGGVYLVLTEYHHPGFSPATDP